MEARRPEEAMLRLPRKGAPLPSPKGFHNGGDGSKTIQFLQFGHHQPWCRQAADQAGRLTKRQRAVPRAARRAAEGLGSRMPGWKQSLRSLAP